MKNKRGCSLAGIARLALLACVTFSMFIIHENAMLVWKKKKLQQNKTKLFIKTFKRECTQGIRLVAWLAFLGWKSKNPRHTGIAIFHFRQDTTIHDCSEALHWARGWSQKIAPPSPATHAPPSHPPHPNKNKQTTTTTTTTTLQKPNREKNVWSSNKIFGIKRQWRDII